MIRFAMIATLIFMPSCSISTLYPGAGATVGGAGALTGYSLGKAAQLADVHQETLKALSEGDVNQLVRMQMEEAKTSGFFDSILAEFYGLMKLLCVGLILWNAIPLVYTYLLKREVKKNAQAERV